MARTKASALAERKRIEFEDALAKFLAMKKAEFLAMKKAEFLAKKKAEYQRRFIERRIIEQRIIGQRIIEKWRLDRKYATTTVCGKRKAPELVA